MQALRQPQMLIVDKLGFAPFSENGARPLFDGFASRYEKGSIAVSANLSFDKRLQISGTPELIAALVDRFSHRFHICAFEGKSARLATAKEKIILQSPASSLYQKPEMWPRPEVNKTVQERVHKNKA